MKRSSSPITEEKLLQKLESSLKNLRIADVELLITAAQGKHLGKSAARHHLSQSATSTAIKRVEAAFGIPLCMHEKRQFRLTREGELFLPRLENWIQQLRDLITTKEQMPIRLVTTHAIAQVVVPPLLALDQIEFKSMRPDHAYAAVLCQEADIALVLDNAPWKGVIATEVGKGNFRLYSKDKNVAVKPVLLPEDQLEGVSLQHEWKRLHGYPIPLKSRIPSWSLIAKICSESDEVGFLPDFLASKLDLHPVSWQPEPPSYRILAIYTEPLKSQVEPLLDGLRKVFAVL